MHASFSKEFRISEFSTKYKIHIQRFQSIKNIKQKKCDDDDDFV